MARAKIFADAEPAATLDLSSFAPKIAADPLATPADQVRAIAESANFRSREPVIAQPAGEGREGAKRQPRRHRTGRSVQFNVKASQATIDAFYALSEAQGWVLGETLEHALAALQRETASRS